MPPVPPKRPRAKALGGHGRGRGRGVAPVPPLPPPAPPPPPEPLPPICPGPGGVDDPGSRGPEAEGDDVVVPAPVPEVEEPPRKRARPDRGINWTASAEDRLVRYDPDYVTPQGVAFAANYTLKCGLGHARCFKVRGVNTHNCKTFGKVEPLAFLHAWAETEPAPGKTHRTTDPSDVAVAAKVEEIGEALEEVIERIGA